MSDITPARIGILVDYIEGASGIDENVRPAMQLAVDEFVEAGLLERPVEFVQRDVQGLPKGSFRAVRDAFFELIEEDCQIIFGPWVSENGEPLREYVERLGEVPIITLAGTESMLGDWVFALNAGSMEEEPIVMAAVASYDGCKSVGIAYEASLIGQQYLRTTREACARYGLRITAEVPIPQVETEKAAAMEQLRASEPDAIVHVGFGLGLLGMNEALEKIGWMPPRYTTTAFEFASNSETWRHRLAGWIGLDQYDERNRTGQAFLDRFEARHDRRPAYYFPLLSYDVGRMMASALSMARPLTGRGVKEALERIKMMPAATGAPGTRLRFGRFIRQAWVGSEYLVARRILPDGSRSVLHGTIEGLIEPPADSS